jgi:hypothetical protein
MSISGIGGLHATHSSFYGEGKKVNSSDQHASIKGDEWINGMDKY